MIRRAFSFCSDLGSDKVGDERIYRIASSDRKSKSLRRAA
jgi:hypothetical protein